MCGKNVLSLKFFTFHSLLKKTLHTIYAKLLSLNRNYKITSCTVISLAY